MENKLQNELEILQKRVERLIGAIELYQRLVENGAKRDLVEDAQEAAHQCIELCNYHLTGIDTQLWIDLHNYFIKKAEKEQSNE